MKTPIIATLFLMLVAFVMPNDALAVDSYLLYAAQFLLMLPYLLARVGYAKNLFLPTLFAQSYYFANLIFGGYLTPRGYGWDREYFYVTVDINTYNVIVPYLLLTNLILFVLTALALRNLAIQEEQHPKESVGRDRGNSLFDLLSAAVFMPLFLLIAKIDVFSAFSFQLSILIVHGLRLAASRNRYRYLIYGFYMATLLAFDFDNKREIAIALFLLVFLEVYYGRVPFDFTFKRIVGYAAAIVMFFGLILSASILRGYGGFSPVSFIDAVRLIPQYVSSEIFVDGVTDNLELNYCYGSAITSIDMSITGIIPYQYGASLAKVLLLPVSRDVFPDKPESTMQIYTRLYSPSMRSNGGSLPVIFPSEMFMNFGIVGLLPYLVIWFGFNQLFLWLPRCAAGTLGQYSIIFLVSSILMFARGSGLELYLVFYVLAFPFLTCLAILGGRLKFAFRGPHFVANRLS